MWSDDFSNASNWLSTNSSVPAHGWEITSYVDSLPYITYNPFSTPSATNGFALVDVTNALLNAETNTDLTWAGTPIDLSGSTNVLLQFYNATHNFSSEYTLDTKELINGIYIYKLSSSLGTGINGRFIISK